MKGARQQTVNSRTEARQVRLTPEADEFLRVFEGAYTLEVGPITTSTLMRDGLKMIVAKTLSENPGMERLIQERWQGKIGEVQF